MNSKFLKNLVLVCIVSTLASCQRFIEDSKPKDEVVQFQSDKFECLNSVAPTLRQIFEGHVVNVEVDRSFNCIHDAMTEFGEKTTDDVYTMTNLVRFFNQHLLSSNQIQLSFQLQLMKIKKLFLGGDEDKLTRAELASLISFFDTLGSELKNMGPYLPLMLQDKKIKSATTPEIDRAVATLQTSVKALYAHMAIGTAPYDLANASEFLKELSQFMKGDDVTEQLNSFRDYLPFVQLCMNLGFGPNHDNLPIPEIKRRSDALIRGYGFYLEYHYQLTENKIKTPEELDKWIRFLDRVLPFFETSSSLSTSGIQYAEVKNVVVDLKKRGWMPWDVTADALDITLRALFTKVGRTLGTASSTSVITLRQWQNIRWEYSQWRFAQLLLAKAPFDNRRYIAIPQLLNWMKTSAPVDSLLAQEGWGPLQKLALKSSWLELQTFLNQHRAIKYNGPGGIMLVDDQTMASYTQSWTDLLRFNVMRGFNRLLFLGYSNRSDSNLFSAQIPESGLVSWYEDFTPIGVDLKLFDPRSGNAGSRSFLEANNFTAYSDGLGGIDYNEGYQYISYLFAAGLVNANNIYDVMKARGCARHDIDILGNPFLDEACFKRNLKSGIATIFANLPYQVAAINRMTDAEWSAYYDALMKVSRTPATEVNAGTKVETSDVRTLVTISHYVESLYTQFDTDKNGLLSDEEIKQGSGRFLPLLRKMRPGIPDFVLQEGFIALVINGEMPSAQDLLASIWQGMTHGRDATRVNLLKVILVLKQ